MLDQKNEGGFWKVVNKKNEKKKNSKIDDRIRKEDWMQHFTEVFDGKMSLNNKKSKEINKYEQENISIYEVRKNIAKLKKKKAPGEDGIKNELLMYGSEYLEKSLHKIINRIWKGEGIPEEWKSGLISPLYKKGDKLSCKNYRPITLMDTGYKLYTSILRDKLQDEMKEKNVLSETQFGFREGRSTTDAIYILKNAVTREINEKRKVYAMFIDLKAAFDNVDRKELLGMMRKFNIKKVVCDRIEEIYTETKSKVKINGEIIGEFWTDKGVRQGCNLSSDCFNIYLSDLEYELSKCTEGGIRVGRKKIWSLSYADDIVLLALSEVALKQMIKKLEKYLEKKKLELNVEKTKILIFGSGRGRKRKNEEKFEWKGMIIEKVKKFKYLGFTLSCNNDNKVHVKEQISKARSVLGKIWGIGQRYFKNNWKKRKLIFEALCKSIIFYGVEIWGYEKFEDVEKIKKKYCKWVFGLDRCTPDAAIRRELKEHSMYIETVCRAVKYEDKIIMSDNNDLVKEILRRKMLRLGSLNEKDKFRNEILEKYKEEIERSAEISKNLKEEEKKNDLKKINESRYCMELKNFVLTDWESEERPIYIEEGREISLIARYRLGNENRACKYWMKEKDKMCRLCKREEETLKHIFQACEISKCKKGADEILKAEGKGRGFMKAIAWKRERKENEENV